LKRKEKTQKKKVQKQLPKRSYKKEITRREPVRQGVSFEKNVSRKRGVIRRIEKRCDLIGTDVSMSLSPQQFAFH